MNGVSRLDLVLATGLSVALGCVYVSTLLPGVGFEGDTAKFQFVGNVLGTPHPTGYPTYIILNCLFTRLLPYGSHAWKANLLSALLSSMAAALLFLTLRELRIRRLSALCGTAACFLIPTIWAYSLVAEVYALHILFLTAVMLGLVEWRTRKSAFWLFFACAAFSFSFGNHMSTALLLPAVVYFVLADAPRVMLDYRKVLVILALVLLGALQYSYLILRTRDPSTPYLETSASNLREVLDVATGGYFRARLLGHSIHDVFVLEMPKVVTRLVWEFAFLVPFTVIGIVSNKDKVVMGFLGLGMLFNVAWVCFYDAPDYYVFLMPSFVIMGVLTAFGLDRLQKSGHKAVSATTCVLAVALPIATLLMNFRGADKSGYVQNDQSVRRVLRLIDRDGVIVSPDYRLSAYYWYYLIGEKQEARGIYLLHHWSVDTLKAYMNGERVFLPEERKAIPAGLPLYCISDYDRLGIEAAGLGVEKIAPGLYKVEQPMGGTSRSR